MSDKPHVMIKTTYYGTPSGERVTTHSHTATWEPADARCPCCGATRIWCEAGGGDYYDGPKHMCTQCGSWFYYRGYELINEDPYDVNYQTLLQLRKNDG